MMKEAVGGINAARSQRWTRSVTLKKLYWLLRIAAPAVGESSF